MDFNTQRKTVKALEEKGRNPLLFIPCLIAKYTVIAFMSICRSIDVAFSDKNGNFLGIKPREKRRKSFEREQAVLDSRLYESQIPEEDRIRPIKGRALWKRAVSTVLAAAFAFMTVPEIGVYAAEPAAEPLTVASMETITYDVFGEKSKSNIYELDLSTNYTSSSAYPLNITANVFRDMSKLTTVTLGYSENMTIGAGNFANIAPNASIFVKADTAEDFEAAERAIAAASGNPLLNIVWDKDSLFYGDIPKEPATFKAYSGISKVILEWTDNGYCDGYSIYRLNGMGYEFQTDILQESVSGVSGGSRRYDIPGTAAETTYAIRPYINATENIDGIDRTYKLYSKLFISSSAKTLAPGTPTITAAASNQKVKLTVKMPDTASEPSYYIIFSRNQQNYEKLVKFLPQNFDPITNTYEYTDPNPYTGENTRSYVVIAYYDIFGRNTETFSDTDENLPEYTTRRSQRADVAESVLTAPSGVTVSLSQDKSYWNMTWNAPEGLEGVSPVYVVYANGVEIQRVSVPFAKIPVTSVINDPQIDTGSDIVFSVAAQYGGMTPSAPVSAEPVNVSSQRVALKKVTAGNSCALITFSPFAGTNRYTLYFSHDVNGTERTDTQRFTASDCTSNADGTLTYTLTGLQNSITYDFSIMSDAASCDFRSIEISVTPSDAPQPPASVTVTAMEKSAEIKWDIVYKDTAKTIPVDGYYLTVRKKSGEIVFEKEDMPGINSYIAQNLENDVPYYAFVSSYVIIGNDPPIESVTSTRSNEFIPTVNVDSVTGLSVVAGDRSIKISWAAVKGATKYYLTKTSEDGSSVKLDMLTNTSYEDKDVRNNVLYTYSVTAVREDNGKSYESPISSPQSAKINIRLNPVQGLTVIGIDGGVKITWDKVTGADGYYVQYYSPEDGKWHTAATVGTTEFVHTGLSKGESYEYRVIPYAMLNGEQIPKPDSISGDYTAQMAEGTAGENLPAPADFTATAGEGLVNLKWTAVDGADGYEIYIIDPYEVKHLLDDVSKTSAVHTNLPNGTTITYCLRAYKYVDGKRVTGDFSIRKTVTVGVLLNAPTDVAARASDGQIALSWKAVTGADGYVVYCYNSAGYSFTPVGIVTSPSFTHTGLTNNRNYTYMIAAYKNINGDVVYSGYSLSVTATPTGNAAGVGTGAGTGSTQTPSDYRIYITGTTPYGMSNSNFISAFAEMGAFNTDIDVRFTLSPDTVTQIQDVMNFYGEGIDSFMIYPMDISLYQAGTDTKVTINPGYYLTLTIPVPDELLPYSENISVVHVSDLSQLEILPSVHADVNGIDCIQFTATSFSPYAFVVYLPEIVEDTSSGTAAAAAGSVQYQTSSSPAFMCTYLPRIYRRRMRNKVFRILSR